MDRVSSNIVKNDFKEAKVKERIDIVCDLVDCYIDKEITEDELVEKLMKVTGKPIIKLSDHMQYIVTEWEGNLYLEYRSQYADLVDKAQDETAGRSDYGDWVQVEDLTELRVWEYNELVSKINEHYPDYSIEYLEGRFV